MGPEAEQPSAGQHCPVSRTHPLGAPPLSGIGGGAGRCLAVGGRCRLAVSSAPAAAGRDFAEGERGPHDIYRGFRERRIVAVRPGHRRVVGDRTLWGDVRSRKGHPSHPRDVRSRSAPRRSPCRRGRVARRIEKPIRHGRRPHCHPDGEVRWIRVRARSHLDDRGSPTTQRNFRRYHRSESRRVGGGPATSGSHASDAGFRAGSSFRARSPTKSTSRLPRSCRTLRQRFICWGRICQTSPRYETRCRILCRRTIAPAKSSSGCAAC